MTNLLEQKYFDFPFSGEFPNLYMVLLYESGGDFTTYSKILGYNDIEVFNRDYNEFNEIYKDKFHIFDIETFGQ